MTVPNRFDILIVLSKAGRFFSAGSNLSMIAMVIVGVAFFIPLKAQTVDSVEVLLKQVDERYNNSPDEALELAQRAYRLSLETEETNLQLRALRFLCITNHVLNQSDSLKHFGHLYLHQADSLNELKHRGHAHTYLGMLAQDQSDFKQAVIEYKLALQDFDSAGFVNGKILTLEYLAQIFQKVDNRELVIKYTRQAIAVLRKTKEAPKKSRITNFYTNLANLYLELAQYDSAEYFLQASIAIHHDRNNERLLAREYSSLGRVYFESGRYQEAIDAGQLAINHGLKTGNERTLMSPYMGMGDSYLQLGDYQKAIDYNLKGLALSTKNNLPRFSLYAHENLSRAYAQNKQYDSAYSHLSRYQSLNDSLLSTDKVAALAGLELKYELKNKQTQIDLLEKEKQIQQLRNMNQARFSMLLNFFLVILLLVGLSVLLAWRYRAAKKAHKLELELLRTKMNPHFLFNCLSAIHSLVIINKKEEAERYITRFSRLIRGILEKTSSGKILLSDELTILEDYLEMQKLRFEDLYQFRIEIAPDINPETIQVPPMLVQPIIENSLEHGFRGIDYTGEIVIRVELKGRQLIMQVIDNGQGIDLKRQRISHPLKTQSLGISLVRQRLKKLRSLGRKSARLTIDSAPWQGTTVTLSIPLK